jgi:hypothetical protein
MSKFLLFSLAIAIAAATAGCSGDQPLADGHLSIQVEVTAVSPRLVPTSGGAEVTVIGKNLPADATVEVDGQPAPGAAWRDDGRITFVSPALPIGSYDVVVRAGGKQLRAARALRAVAQDVSFAEPTSHWASFPAETTDREDARWRIADIDGDGLDDVVLFRAPTFPNGELSLLLADGAGGSRLASSLKTAEPQPGLVTLADADGDGHPELIESRSLRSITPSGFSDPIPLVADPDFVIGAAEIDGAAGHSLALLVFHDATPVTTRLVRATLANGVATVTPLPDPALAAINAGLVNTPDGERLSALDFDGDGESDLAYLSADSAVILRGPGFTESWTVPGAFAYLQHRRVDLDHDQKNDLVVGDYDHVTVAFDHGGPSPEIAVQESSCGIGRAQRGFSVAAEGVATDLVGVQCPQVFHVLAWDLKQKWLYPIADITHATETSTVVGTGGLPLWFDSEDVAVPHFARLSPGKPPGILVFDYQLGAIDGQWSGKDDEFLYYQPGPPLLDGRTVVAGRFPGRQVVTLTADGVVLARSPGGAAPLRLALGMADETTANVLATACDVDGDGVDEAVLGFNGQTTKLVVVKVGANQLSLRSGFESTTPVRGNFAEFVRATTLDADGDGRCDVLLFNKEELWTHDANGWKRNDLSDLNQPNGLDSLVVRGQSFTNWTATDVDHDGDDDVVATVGQELWLGESKPGPTIAWRKLEVPAEQFPLQLSGHDGAIASIRINEEGDVTGPVHVDRGHVEGDALVIDATSTSLSLPLHLNGMIGWADVDGDGVADILADAFDLTSYRDQVLVVRTLPEGALAPAQVAPLPRSGSRGSGIVAADLDGDGLADLAYSMFVPGQTYWARNVAR